MAICRNSSASIQGQAAPGFSSGQALEIMEGMATATLPDSMGTEWTGLAYQEKLAGSQAGVIFGLALIFVYLVLAAQYESWGIPFAVILAVPLGILGAVAATIAREFNNNTYTQIGLVLLVALAARLIVMFGPGSGPMDGDMNRVQVESAQASAGASIVRPSATIHRFMTVLRLPWSTSRSSPCGNHSGRAGR